MTLKFYKWFNRIFLFIFVPVVLLNHTGDNVAFLQDHIIFREAIYYANPILSLVLFFFGWYVFVSNKKSVIKIGRPILIIFLGSCFTMLAYAPPIIALLKINDNNISNLSPVELKKIESVALNLNVSIDERVDAAKYYYFETGRLIEYYANSYEKRYFSPQEDDLDERQRQVRQIKQFELFKNDIKEVNKYLFWISILLSSCFLIIILIFRGSTKWEPKDK